MADKILSFRIDVQGVSKEAQEIAKVESALEKLNQERKESQQLLKKGNITRKQYENSLAKIRSKSADLKAERTKLTAVERKAAQLYKTTTGSINSLRLRMTKLRDEMKGLNLETAKGRDRFKRLNAEYQKGTTRLRNFDRQMSGSKTLVGEYGRGIKGAFTSLALGITAGVAGFRTLQRAIQSATQDLANFEKQQVNVQTLLDQFNDTLSADTLALVKQYGLEIADVNKALFDAVSAGVPATRAIEFLDEATKLAIGGVTDLTTAVDGITSVLNGYGLSIDNADRVASAFFSAQKFGKTTVAELAAEVGKVVPVANQLDVNFQELLSTYAELTKQGISTTESTTAIRSIMTAVLKPAEEAKDIFDELGIAYGATNVSQRGFLNVLGDITKAVEEGNTELADLLPNVRALTGAGALGTRQLEDLDEILKVVNEDFGEGSSLAKANEQQLNTLSTSIGRIGAGFKTARIAFGEFLAPAIRGLADLINPTQQLSDKLEVQQGTVNRLVAELQNVNIESDRRLGIIEQLNELAPDIVKNIDAENISIQALTVSLTEFNAQIAQRIALASLEEEEQEILAKQARRRVQLTKAQTTSIKTLNKGLGVLAERGIEIPEAVTKATEDLIGLVSDTLNEPFDQERAKELYNTILTSLNDVGSGARIAGEQLLNTFTITTAGVDNASRAYRNFVDTNTDALEELRLAQELLVSTLPTPVTPEGPQKPGAKPKPSEERVGISALIFEGFDFSDKQMGLIRDRIADIDEVFEDSAELRLREQKSINDFILSQWEKEEEAFRQKEELKQRLAQATNAVISAGVNFLFANNQKLLNEELAAAGDNEEKKAEIREKFAKREQKIAIAEAAIKAGLIILNALQTVPFIPAGLIASVVAGTMAAIQIASIKQQTFAGGGRVQQGYSLPGSQPGTDNTPAMLTPGEVVLNAPQQAALGGDGTFKRIGVPGFASGGAVGVTAPQPANGIADMRFLASMITAGLNTIKVVQNVNELNDAQDELTVINRTNEV